MKIGIVGSGMVGATAAYALLMRGIGREVVLVDVDRQRAQAEASDLSHAVPFAHAMQVHAGDMADLNGSTVIILAAGVGQRPGESRLELLARNAAIFREIVPQVLEHAPGTVLLVATNPVDVLTHLTTQIVTAAGLSARRVIGSGTTLDTARFRTLLGKHFGVDPQHVHAYVVGEHGDSEVLTWSLATIAGTPIDEFCQLHDVCLEDETCSDIETNVKDAAQNIIAGKGATYYGIGSALARIVEAIIHDQRAVLTVSGWHAQVSGVSQVSLSLPHLVGGAGILETWPLPLNAGEEQALEQSARIIRHAIESIKE